MRKAKGSIRPADDWLETYNKGVKSAALILAAVSLCLAQQKGPGSQENPPDQPHGPGVTHNGNFGIRFEPKAVLQTNAPIPFEIDVTDDLRKPLIQAKVTLQIETAEDTHVKVYNAPMTNPGIYIAKPVFPDAGQWNVYVEVHRGDGMSARTIQYYVPEAP